jgi:hypothetical protein
MPRVDPVNRPCSSIFHESDMIAKCEDPSMLWREYSYRHSHIWRVVFQLTAAVVALSIVPYLDSSGNSGILPLAPLPLAVGLVWFAFLRLKSEFRLFDSATIHTFRQPDGAGTNLAFAGTPCSS